MHVSREELYLAVWAEPVHSLAKKYGVSGSFLARVCTDLKVPRPERGYWAKLAHGKKVNKPSLPPSKPGDFISWSPGGGLFRPELPIEAPEPSTIRTIRRRKDRPAQHELLVKTVPAFKKTWKDSETGHLRPMSTALADIVVSKDESERAIALANELYLSLEDRGHNVALDSGYRPDPFNPDEHPNAYGRPNNWRPSQPTIVYIGTVEIGLSIFENTELLDARYSFDHGGYVRASSLKREQWHSTPSKHPFPCRLLTIRAFSAYQDTRWLRDWTENKRGDLLRQVPTIIKEIEAAAPSIVPLVEAARLEHEARERQWEADQRRWKREEQARRRREASEASLKDLSSIIEAWAEARSIEAFFEDIETRAQGLPTNERAVVAERTQLARNLLGGVDALKRFKDWLSPEDRLGRAFRAPDEDAE